MLYVLHGNVRCSFFYVAMSVVGYFSWQCGLLGLLNGNVCCCMF